MFFLHKFGSLEFLFWKIFNISENNKIKVKAAKVQQGIIISEAASDVGFEAFVSLN